MATKKTKRRAKSKSNGGAFPAMSEVLKAIEDNFKALAAMVPTGAASKPKRRAPAKRKAAKRATARTKTAIKRAAAKTKRAMPKAKKPRRRGDKRPSAAAPV